MGKLYTEEEYLARRRREYDGVVQELAMKMNVSKKMVETFGVWLIRERMTTYVDESYDPDFWEENNV